MDQICEDKMLYHTKINVDNRCLDLLLTQEDIAIAFERSLKEENRKYIDVSQCCSCWPTQKPPACKFWQKIFGLCSSCSS